MNQALGDRFHVQSCFLAFVPALATEWHSPSPATHTFRIRTGVRFHAGGTLEPHDVAYSLQGGVVLGGSSASILISSAW